jgi:hypothetical protein
MDTAELIDNRIAELGGWRGDMLALLRKLIRSAAPELVEEWKWDTPVWSSNGNVLAVGAFQDHLKINFFHGALLEDHSLFNAGLDAQKTRAIDIFEGDKVDEAALSKLIHAAAELNSLKAKPAKPVKKESKAVSAKKKINTARKKRFGTGRSKGHSNG